MGFRRITSSIVTRLVLFGVALALTGSVVRYHRLPTFLRDDLGTVMAGQQAALAGYVARDITAKLDERERTLHRLAAAAPLGDLNDREALQAWLAAQHRLQSAFVPGLAILAPDGRALAEVRTATVMLASNTAETMPTWVRNALKGTPALGRPLRAPQTGETLLPMAAPITDPQGRVLAVLTGLTALDAPGFLQPLAQARVGSTGGLLVISPHDRLIVAATDPEQVLRAAPAMGQIPLFDAAAIGHQGGGLITEASGAEAVAGVAPVPGAGWFVVARMPADEAFVTIERTRHFVRVHAVATVVIFLLLASVGLYLVFRPLLRAADHADRMSRGDMPLAPLPVARDDEVGHLTKAFNRLLARLIDSQNELARMAHHDALTGLPNRLLLADRMGQALARARRTRTRLAVLFMDLDGFKPINDSLGHEAGDLALVEVGRRLAAIVRESDTLSRVGGDEFALVLSDLGPDSDEASASARAVATKCMQALAEPVQIAGQPCALGLSIGIALGDGDSSFDALMSTADSAMYQAKQMGRGRYVLHLAEPEVLDTSPARLTG